MAIRCGKDMSAIIKGHQKDLIRMILEDRDFALVQVKVDENLTPVGKRLARSMVGTNHLETICGIREEGTLCTRNQCDFLLSLGKARRQPNELPTTPWHEPCTKKEVSYDISEPSIEEFLDFMKGRELIFETQFFDHGGGYEEDLVNAFCRDVLLLRRKQDKYLTDDSYQVNVFLQKVTDDISKLPDALTPVSVKDFTICSQMMESMEKIVWEHYEGLNESDIVINFETRMCILMPAISLRASIAIQTGM